MRPVAESRTMKRKVADLGAGSAMKLKSAVLVELSKSAPGFALAVMPLRVWASILFFALSETAIMYTEAVALPSVFGFQVRFATPARRSEERRVGKECRSR